MYKMPALDLLEQSHTFPGPYTFKVIGKPENGFLARILGGVREALGLEADPPFRVREAVGGRHIAITLVPHIETAQKVLAVYGRLQTMTGLVYLW
jgi:putative lipoic acid-binding regulatory protein